MTAETVTNAAAAEVKVWDPLVRVCHWSLVALFLISYLTGDEQSRLHEWAGYAVLGLMAVRMIWGLVGTPHARFGDFVFGPSAVLAYVKDLLLLRPKRYLGHNPLGGIMIVLMLVTLLATGLSGLALQRVENDDDGLAALSAAPFPALIASARADEDEEHENEAGEDWIEETHELLANFMVLLVLLHIAGVALGSLLHRENLVRAMFTGRKHV